MQNSKKYEKSRGILAFAYNTDTTNYVSIATQTLELASKKLRIPYTLITDEPVDPTWDNVRYSIDSNEFVPWKNLGRYVAYDASPYDETIVIDVDYIVQDNSLLKIFELEWDYLLLRNTQTLMDHWPATMGQHSLPLVWATVFAFRKTERAKQYFNLIRRVHDNYSYYRHLFNVRERNYRNDYAFAIADIILNGYTIPVQSLPDFMITVEQPIESITCEQTRFVIKNTERAFVVPRSNLHIISKKYLHSNNFKNLIQTLINEPA